MDRNEIIRCVDILKEAAAILLKDEYPTIGADPVKHGRWTTNRTLEHDGEWYCTVCGYEPIVFKDTPYCPNCGAKMDGGER